MSMMLANGQRDSGTAVHGEVEVNILSLVGIDQANVGGLGAGNR